MKEPRQPDAVPPRRLPIVRREVEREVDEELRFHLQSRADALVRDGLSPGEAWERALREYGDLEASRRELARVDRGRLARWRLKQAWDGLWADVRYTARALRRQPGYTTVVVLTLALAMGANATMFGIIDRLLLRGVEHVRAPERVKRIYVTREVKGRGLVTRGVVAYADYADLTAASRTFERVAAYAFRDGTTGEGAGARQLHVAHATAGFFRLLGVQPLLGRFFTEDEDRPPAGQLVAVINERVWRSTFGADTTVLGGVLRIDGVSFTVIGVVPASFTGAELAPVDVWLPLSVQGARMQSPWTTTRDSRWIAIVGRLTPRAAVAQAGTDATTIFRTGNAGRPEITGRTRVDALPISFNTEGKEPLEASVSRWLAGVALMVLLIAAANIANLLLVRASRRRREVAVRLALGINRLRLVRLLVLESLLLTAGGMLAGLILAYRGAPIVRMVLLPDVAWTSAPVNVRVLAFVASLALVTGILVGLVPALQASRTDLTTTLRTGARNGAGDASRLRAVLLVLQPAFAAVLLIGAGLFVASLRNARTMDLGIQADRVLTVDVAWPTLAMTARHEIDAERARRLEFVRTALDRARHLPWVERASLSIGTPFQVSFGVDVFVPGRDSLPALPGGGPFITVVSPDYFETVGTRIVRGRPFGSGDRAGSERVVIVNETMARTLWPLSDALDKCIVVFAAEVPCARVVGVVNDVHRFRLREGPSMQFYVPLGQEQQISGTSLLVRPRDGDTPAARGRLRRELQSLRPDLPYAIIRSLQERIDPQVRPWSLGAFMFTVFGALALFLAAVGLYSVLAHLVEQRTYEFGVRAALGASSGSILRNTMRRGFMPAALGLAIGVTLALILGRFVEPMLFDTSARDPRIFGGVALLLSVISLLASVVPAWKAMRIDPLIALKAE